MDNRPIGVFDSGLGGLTVLNEIMNFIPNESVVYFGDNGRYPYGTKSKETVVKFAFQDIRFLINQDIKMVVIACNTVSTNAYQEIKAAFDIPVIEVVKPGAISAVKATRNGKIGVIGTDATIKSKAYEDAILDIDSKVQIYSKACPLFVNLAEEGWWDNDIALRIAEEYLIPMRNQGIDTLVLGCTHYPLLTKTISKVMGDGVTLVNSALEVAREVKKIINEKDISRDEGLKPVYRYYTSDSVERFESLGNALNAENSSI
jgi:glutamate racemase